MLDFDTLERRCKKYYWKKRAPYILLFLLFVGALAVFGYSNLASTNEAEQKRPPRTIESNMPKETKATPLKPASVESAAKKPQPKSLKSTSPVVQKTHKTTRQKVFESIPDADCYSLQFASAKKKYADYLEPKKKRLESLGFSCFYRYKNYAMLRCDRTTSKEAIVKSIHKAKRYKLHYILFSLNGEECTREFGDFEGVSKQKPVMQKTRTSAPKEATHPTNNVTVNQAGSSISMTSSTLKELETLFQKRQSYSIAMQIAREYYQKGEYEASLKWAKKANKLDRKKEDAWVMYAKSLYKLGKKSEAKKILMFYLKFENSTGVKELLRQWESE